MRPTTLSDQLGSRSARTAQLETGCWVTQSVDVVEATHLVQKSTAMNATFVYITVMLMITCLHTILINRNLNKTVYVDIHVYLNVTTHQFNHLIKDT